MLVTFLWSIFTLFISTINALTVGSVWRFKGKLSGWMQFIVWSGRIMAVIGFFMVILIVVVWVMYQFSLFEILAQALFNVELTHAAVGLLMESIFNLSYLLIIFPVIGLGLGITVHSWITAFREKSLLSGGLALYNTGATVYNIVNAVRFVPKVSKALYESIGKTKVSGIPVWMWFALVALPLTISLGGAILITNWIMKLAENKYPEIESDSLEYV
jgi:hypothetical protein